MTGVQVSTSRAMLKRAEESRDSSSSTYVAVRLDAGLDAHVRAEDDLERVVDELHSAGLDRGHTGLHHERADDDKREVDDADSEHGRKVRERVALHRRALVALRGVEIGEDDLLLDVSPLLVRVPECGGGHLALLWLSSVEKRAEERERSRRRRGKSESASAGVRSWSKTRSTEQEARRAFEVRELAHVGSSKSKMDGWSGKYWMRVNRSRARGLVDWLDRGNYIMNGSFLRSGYIESAETAQGIKLRFNSALL